MLANLTSLIWGSGNTPVIAGTTTTTVTPYPEAITTTTTTTTTTKDAYEETPEGFTNFNIRASTPTDEEEADWVLVDRAEASCGVVESIASATATSPSALTTTSTTATSPPVPPVTVGGEWSDGGTQVSPSSQPAVTEREDSPMKENTSEQVENQVAAEAPPTRGGVTQRAPSLLRAIDVLRPAQKAQRRREERRLKRSALERSNKVREVAAAGNKCAKRCDLMAPGKFSRAVNNRKC